MVRITADLVRESPQFLNPLKQREIDLRSNKIPIIENLGATLDQFDAIDLSDNDIARVEGFPTLKRLKTLFINNNRVSKIAPNLSDFLPNLEELILTNNNIQEFADIETIANLKTVTRLSIMRNPIANKKHYREFTIYKMPQLVLLDFRKIKDRERAEAQRLFAGAEGAKRLAELVRSTASLGGDEMPANGAAGVDGQGQPEAASGGLSEAQVQKIKAAIQNAQSLQEIQRLENILQTGAIPDDFQITENGAAGEDMES